MAGKGDPTHDEIAKRAHEISQRPDVTGNDEDNWYRAEQELRAEGAAPEKKPRKRAVKSAVPEAD